MRIQVVSIAALTLAALASAGTARAADNALTGKDGAF